ncbi:hypothetical protein, partial [Acinetobacter ursingii]|uniref:hypothetical protein n=1 Tax=Acinetobacter ursingii TaxID=108980 RepID=UPI003AF7DEDB
LKLTIDSLNSFEYLIAIIKSSFMMYYIEQFVRNSIIGAKWLYVLAANGVLLLVAAYGLYKVIRIG